MNSSSVTIRLMCLQDIEQVLQIAAVTPTAPHWNQSAYIQALNHPRLALVAEERNFLVGFAVVFVVDRQAELEFIAVVPEQQKKGVARALFKNLMARLQAVQVSEVILEVRASNLPAQAFYRSLGFVESGRRPRYYVDPIEDAVLMNLPIA
jgi:[ribosomal protein S18]-alanine N-acetyltransferase